MQAVRKLLAWLGLIQGDTPPPTEKQLAVNFSREFSAKFTNGGGDEAAPTFEALSYLSALEKAKANMKCLFVYLHSPVHYNAAKFCRTLASSSEMSAFLQANFLCWGASVQERDGYNIACEFNAVDFPFVALVCPTAPAAQIIFRASGTSLFVKSDELVSRMQRAMTVNQELVEKARELQRIRNHDRMLTQQQDLEYEAARQRDRERREKVRAEKSAARAEQQAAEAKKRELDEQASVEAATKEKKLEQARTVVTDELEPEPSQKPYTVLRFQFPDGKRFGRKFTTSTTFRQIRAYVTVEMAQRNIEIERFNLFLAAKRKTFSEDDDGGMTLQDAGLSADVLLVQDLDA